MPPTAEAGSNQPAVSRAERPLHARLPASIPADGAAPTLPALQLADVDVVVVKVERRCNELAGCSGLGAEFRQTAGRRKPLCACRRRTQRPENRPGSSTMSDVISHQRIVHHRRVFSRQEETRGDTTGHLAHLSQYLPGIQV